MDLITIILLAIGLSMDAFAVSVTNGIIIKKVTLTHSLKIALCFGFFQALMPLLGWYFASYFSAYIIGFDHWIAFILLTLIGGKMVHEAFEEEDIDKKTDPTQIGKLLLLGIATSIDALAVGVNFAFIQTDLFLTIAIIGLTTFSISFVGVYFGKTFGAFFKKEAEIFGGVVLFLIGLRILIEHLFF